MIVPYRTTGKKGKISVWLDDATPSELKPFFCPVCGKIVFEYYSTTNLVIPGGGEKIDSGTIVVQCHWCKTKFFIK